jgi:hypothetical protein
MTTADAPHALKIFVSYAHRDHELFKAFLDATTAERAGASTWSDLEIVPGDTWDPMILRQLDRSDLVIVLLSSNFLASRFCTGVEMRRALAYHENRWIRVMPVLVAPCEWRTSPLAALQGLPSGMRAVIDWPNQADAWRDVARGIKSVVDTLVADAHAAYVGGSTYNELEDFTDSQLIRMIEEIKVSINVVTETIAAFPLGSEPTAKLIELNQLKRRILVYEREFRSRGGRL